MTSPAYKFIFAGGGTGGHLYPAVAVAEQIKVMSPESKILFVGTKHKIESRVIPKLGYPFKSIWVSGFSRKLTVKNLLFPIKMMVSFIQSFILNIKFKPNVAIGAGAYVSGPVAWVASILGSKLVLLEQNSFPGITNRMLEKRADSVHISFEDSRSYFKNKSKIKLTGNPIRISLKLTEKIDAKASFSLNENRKVLLVIGGSLGASSINEAISKSLEELVENKVQLIWQTGELYYEKYKHYESKYVRVLPFLSNMAEAYSASDLVVARAGATTIAEVAYLGLPVIFVPSTNVAANHQYKNAESIVSNNGGLLLEDKNLFNELVNLILSTIGNEKLLKTLSTNIQKFSKPDAAKEIALDVLRLAKKK